MAGRKFGERGGGNPAESGDVSPCFGIIAQKSPGTVKNKNLLLENGTPYGILIPLSGFFV